MHTFTVWEFTVRLQKRDMFFMRAHSKVPDSYITLLWGPPCSTLELYSEVPPQLSCSFAAQQHTDVSGCCRGWGWGWGSGRGCCHGAAAEQACVPTDWGRKDANPDSAGRAPAASVVVKVWRMLGTPERADWPPVAIGRVLAAAFFLCRIWNEKSKDSPGPGGLTQRQIPGVDVELHSCLLADLGPGETLFLPILLCLLFLDINQ